MCRYFAVLMGLHIIVSAAPPLKLTIDCGSQETDFPRDTYGAKSTNVPNQVDLNYLCTIIHKALPKSVNDGKFILIGESTDQSHASNDLIPVTIHPPRRFKQPRIKLPNFKVPRLKPHSKPIPRPFYAPRVGAPMHFPSLRARGRRREEESSAERMEKFKKGVQKMLHVVKVLGQIDQYLSERTRSVIDVLSKTFTEKDSYSHNDY